MNRIYHNPRCSKSHATLALLERNGVEVEVIEYLKAPPSKQELDDICRRLDIEPLALIRTKEKLFGELGLSKTDRRGRDEWLAILARHPQLLERPIVIRGDRAAIGRPPENVLGILS